MNDPTSMPYNWISVSSPLPDLKTTWLQTLTAPQDGMWESFTNHAQHWQIQQDEAIIGYAAVNEEACLLQFYLKPEWRPDGLPIFAAFIEAQNIRTALIGTNNPHCLSLALHFQKQVEVDTYLFSDFFPTEPKEINGDLRFAKKSDLSRIVDFCYMSMGAPREWLKGYIGDLIAKGEIQLLEEGGDIMGTCEVRKSESNPQVADVGMVVAPAQRKRGVGTYLLGRAKATALAWGRRPICSCEKGNIGSLKSIQKNGFRSVHQILRMKF